MAPEAWTGFVGKSCDLWSVAVMIFLCITGVLPFHTTGPIMQHGPPAPALVLSAEDKPRFSHLVPILAKALAFNPDARYASAKELADSIQPECLNACCAPH
mmetsp:Transcript_41476/g.89899  ORF Transcript_41476/g.89899 Transcript_41476/m.89899 type:complete len:101 (-) Transcript_41476:117-419(-)